MRHILCIGDSHTAGFPNHDPMLGGDCRSSYQYWLSEKIAQLSPDAGFNFINRGVCGDTSGGIVSRLFNFLEKQSVGLIILQGGTNDLGMYSAQEIFENLKKGYLACCDRGIPVVAVTIPPLNFIECEAAVLSANSAIRSHTGVNGNVFVADWFEVLCSEKNRLKTEYDSGDGVHLSVAGYRKAGYATAQPVLDALSERKGQRP